MPIVNGTLTDFGLDPLTLNSPVLIFRASSTGLAGLNILSARKAVEVEPLSNGYFEADLVATALIAPETTHYTVEIRYRETATGMRVSEILPWKLLVPPEGGTLGDLLRVPANPALVWTGTQPPIQPSPGTWWLDPDTGDLQELDGDGQTWTYKANLRGPAGYNATDAAGDAQALADFTLETAGTNPFAEALAGLYARRGEITPTGIAPMIRGLVNRNTSILRGVVQGSSTVEGSNASPRTNRWTNRIEKMMQKSFNPAGINGGYSLRGNDYTNWTKTGTHTDQKAAGFGLRTLELQATSTATHAATITDGFTLNFIPGATNGGVVDIQIDGGPAVRYSPKNSSTGEWKSGVLTRAAHTIKITAIERTVIESLYVHDGDHLAGVQFLSAGVGGATASNYANDANTEHWARISRMGPSVFCAPIMLGSNDYMAQIPPSTFKADLLTMIAKTHTAIGRPVWTPLIGMPERTIAPLPIPYSKYLDVLKEIAEESPEWITYHDLAPFFPKTQAADYLNLIDTDDTHPTNAGHRLEADLLADMWNLPERVIDTATVPPLGTGATVAEFNGIAFDDFNRADTSGTLGVLNTGQSWQVGTSSWRINSLAAQGLGYAYIDAGVPNYEISADIKIDARSGVAGLILKYIDDANRITAWFDLAGNVLRIAVTNAGTATILGDAAYTSVVGATVNLKLTYRSGVITSYIDGVQAQQYTLTGADLTKFGPITAVGMRQNEYNAHLDNFTVKP